MSSPYHHQVLINDPAESSLRTKVGRAKRGTPEEYLYREGYTRDELVPGDDVGLVVAAYALHQTTRRESPDGIQSRVVGDVLLLGVYLHKRLTPPQREQVAFLSALAGKSDWEPIGEYLTARYSRVPEVHPDARPATAVRYLHPDFAASGS